MQDRERKIEKKLKKQIICSFAVGAAGIALLIGSLICSTTCYEKTREIEERYRYEEANAKYKAEMAMDLSEQYSNGLIDDKQYNTKLSNIKNLNKKEFIQENANQDTYKKYKTLTDLETISTIAVLPSILCTGAFGAGIAICANNEKRKELKDAGIELE